MTEALAFADGIAAAEAGKLAVAQSAESIAAFQEAMNENAAANAAAKAVAFALLGQAEALTADEGANSEQCENGHEWDLTGYW